MPLCLPGQSSPLRRSLLSAAVSSDFKNKNFDSHVSLQFPISLFPFGSKTIQRSHLCLRFSSSLPLPFFSPSDSGGNFHMEKLKKMVENTQVLTLHLDSTTVGIFHVCVCPHACVRSLSHTHVLTFH